MCQLFINRGVTESILTGKIKTGMVCMQPRTGQSRTQTRQQTKSRGSNSRSNDLLYLLRHSRTFHLHLTSEHLWPLLKIMGNSHITSDHVQLPSRECCWHVVLLLDSNTPRRARLGLSCALVGSDTDFKCVFWYNFHILPLKINMPYLMFSHQHGYLFFFFHSGLM